MTRHAVRVPDSAVVWWYQERVRIAEGVGEVMECASCAAGFDHCHGTLVVHSDGGFADCTAEDCFDDDRFRHSLVVDCFALGDGCACAVPAGITLSRAS